jgi:chemotaxis receptor (MCP) glutamine deamidase CheD
VTDGGGAGSLHLACHCRRTLTVAVRCVSVVELDRRSDLAALLHLMMSAVRVRRTHFWKEAGVRGDTVLQVTRGIFGW